MVCDVGCVEMVLGFGIEVASFVVRLIRGEMDQIHLHRHRRRPIFLFH